eukprot:TRINITY_DN96488_c0_g1_i1.p1 TRINITY_DN96488_c0_g1~~TRINITY_DN96488_c0_g1_i1.p1  ORF type:complete len:280 (+),score=38.65 TRINITY_DN96488_c0_g1_i1:29-841(+)
MTKHSLLALGGFGASWGGPTPNFDVLQHLNEKLAHVLTITELKPPNIHQESGLPAWFSGDQDIAGRLNGWTMTEEALCTARNKGETPELPPPPVSAASVPPKWTTQQIMEGECPLWDDIGFQESMDAIQAEWDTGRYSGLLGFSQGALAAFLFILKQQKANMQTQARQPKLVVLCCGFTVPLPPASMDWFDCLKSTQCIQVPSLHVFSTKDCYVANKRTEELAELFDTRMAQLYEHDCVCGASPEWGGHTVPWDNGFLSTLGSFASGNAA